LLRILNFPNKTLSMTNVITLSEQNILHSLPFIFKSTYIEIGNREIINPLSRKLSVLVVMSIGTLFTAR